MKTKYAIIFAMLCAIVTYSQKQKIKGNKIVETKVKMLTGFHTVDLYDNFEVILQEDSDPMVKVEADSNLQDFIDIKVQDSVLKITSLKKIRRAKSLKLTIKYGNTLKKLSTHNAIALKSSSPISSASFWLNVQDESEVFLTLKCKEIQGKIYNKSHAELHASADKINYEINESAELKGIVTADKFTIDIFDKSHVKLEGELDQFSLHANGSTDFYGQKLQSQKAVISVSGTSDCYLLAKEEISITAMEDAEVYILGEPKINLTRFADQAILYKKEIDYKPGFMNFSF